MDFFSFSREVRQSKKIISFGLGYPLPFSSINVGILVGLRGKLFFCSKKRKKGQLAFLHFDSHCSSFYLTH